MQRRSFFGGLFGGLVAWLFGTSTAAAASPPYVTVLTGDATLFMSRGHAAGEFADYTVTEKAIRDVPVKLIRYGDGTTVVKWDVTERIYCALDLDFGVPMMSLIITPRKGLTRTAAGETTPIPARNFKREA